MRISLDGYNSKIRKVSRCRPTVSNETSLATKKEFFFVKVAPVKSITDIVLLGFWLILLSRMFISSYVTIFFVNNFFFECLYFNEYDIRMLLIVFGWEIGYPLSTYATGEMVKLVKRNSYTNVYLKCLCDNTTSYFLISRKNLMGKQHFHTNTF